jgi:hypothetical protein
LYETREYKKGQKLQSAQYLKIQLGINKAKGYVSGECTELYNTGPLLFLLFIYNCVVRDRGT